jgi:hypothetical protein
MTAPHTQHTESHAKKSHPHAPPPRIAIGISEKLLNIDCRRLIATTI